MLLYALIALLPLLTDGAGACSLPPPSREQLNVNYGTTTWYQQYAYPVPGALRHGCFIATQSPGPRSYQLRLNGTFSREPLLPVTATVTQFGNRMLEVYDGVWDTELSGPYNLIYTDHDFFIDHFCYLGQQEIVEVYTTTKILTKALLQKLSDILDRHREVKKNLLVKVSC